MSSVTSPKKQRPRVAVHGNRAMPLSPSLRPRAEGRLKRSPSGCGQWTGLNVRKGSKAAVAGAPVTDPLQIGRRHHVARRQRFTSQTHHYRRYDRLPRGLAPIAKLAE
jgi:hypothetical protein